MVRCFRKDKAEAHSLEDKQKHYVGQNIPMGLVLWEALTMPTLLVRCWRLLTERLIMTIEQTRLLLMPKVLTILQPK